jgi:UDP-4-amino-4,6-dideoxy-N-acetyl-beta-L-altrosamine transaminase
LSQGPKIKELEDHLKVETGSRYCVVVSSGTAALHLAVKSLNLRKGGEGITSPLTFVATANSLLYNGLTPRFADIEGKTHCIDPEEVQRNITDKTGVIIPVHFAGHPADMEKIAEIAGEKRIPIIEDAAHAIGSKFANGHSVGSCFYSDLTVFSFHPVKTITTGEGGAITTNRKEIYEKLLMMRNHGFTKDPDKFKTGGSGRIGSWYHEMQELGFNYRMTDFQAALGVSQLNKLDRFIKRRREIIQRYGEALGEVPWITLPKERSGISVAFHLYIVMVNFERIGKSRIQAMRELKRLGINTQVHYIPVHLHPYYREEFGFKEGDFPRSERYYRHCLTIPLYPRMTNEDVERVIGGIVALGGGI